MSRIIVLCAWNGFLYFSLSYWLLLLSPLSTMDRSSRRLYSSLVGDCRSCRGLVVSPFIPSNLAPHIHPGPHSLHSVCLFNWSRNHLLYTPICPWKPHSWVQQYYRGEIQCTYDHIWGLWQPWAACIVYTCCVCVSEGEGGERYGEVRFGGEYV